MYREHYFMCFSEKRIYHSMPTFNSPAEKLVMAQLGIPRQETWIRITAEQAIKYAGDYDEHYVYTAYTTAQWEIIDCPELLAYQLSQNLEGNYIPMMNVKKNIKKEDIIEDITITDLYM